MAKKITRKTGRPKPMVPKAGITRTHRRYGDGGKTKTK